MSGEHHFNEVTFNEVFIDDTNLLGRGGRRLATGDRRVVAFERSGPERILTTAPMLTATAAFVGRSA